MIHADLHAREYREGGWYWYALVGLKGAAYFASIKNPNWRIYKTRKGAIKGGKDALRRLAFIEEIEIHE